MSLQLMEHGLLRMQKLRRVLQTGSAVYCKSQGTGDLASMDDIRFSWEYRLKGLGGSFFRGRSVCRLVLCEQGQSSWAKWVQSNVEQ